MPNIPKPPKGEKYDAAANDWMAGKMEADAEKERKQAKSKSKPFVESTTVEPANTRRMAEYKRSLGLIPDADYRNEAKNAYHDAETGTPRRRVITRNDNDLAAQSRMDELVGNRPRRQHGGGPSPRSSNYSTPMNLGGESYAKGGSISRGDGIAQKGKTKGRFV